MVVLIIIGSIILIVAIINWEQSNGFIRNLFNPNKKLLSSDTEIENNGTVTLNSDNQTLDSFSDEDYARDDSSDYI